jgi:hypothetical protein
MISKTGGTLIMPKCVVCSNLLPPQYMIEMPNVETTEEIPLKCIFCHTGKPEVTVVEDATHREEKYTKQQCIEDYKTMLKMMKEAYEKGGVKNTGILKKPEKIIKLH